MLFSDLVDAAQTLIKFGVQYLASDASANILRGINALRCMLSSFAENAWNFLASAYWALAMADWHTEVHPWLDEAYMFVCTCQEDMKLLNLFLGAGEEAGDALTMCSENASNKKLEV